MDYSLDEVFYFYEAPGIGLALFKHLFCNISVEFLRRLIKNYKEFINKQLYCSERSEKIQLIENYVRVVPSIRTCRRANALSGVLSWYYSNFIQNLVKLIIYFVKNYTLENNPCESSRNISWTIMKSQQLLTSNYFYILSAVLFQFGFGIQNTTKLWKFWKKHA